MIDLTKIAVRLMPSVNYDEYAAFKKFANLLKKENNTFVGDVIGSWETVSHKEFAQICFLHPTAYVDDHNALVLDNEYYPAGKTVVTLGRLKQIVDGESVSRGAENNLHDISTDSLIDLIKSAQKELKKRTQGVL